MLVINGQIDNITLTVYTLQDNNFDFGLRDYPIFDENYREILNKAILDYYIFHEIGWQNVNVFKHYLNARMSLIMRNKYNALYIAKAKDFNPLYTLDVYDDYTHTVENNNTGEVNSTNESTVTSNDTNNTTVNSSNTTNNTNNTLALASNYPSENMANNDLTSNVFVNNGQKNTGTTNGTDTTEETNITNNEASSTSDGVGKTTNIATSTTTETYSKHSYGSASDLSFAHAMVQFKDYCDKFDLDNQVISELSDLFVNVY